MKLRKTLALVLTVCMLVMALSACGSKPAGDGKDWPKKGITIICPFKAGGGMDLSTRLTAKYLEKKLGVTVTVSNVEGGNSWTGWTQVAQAGGDGYTLGFANYPAQVAGYLNPSAGISYTYKSFTSIANIVADANILVVSAKHSQFTTAEEFLEYAKTNEVVLGTGGGAGCDDDVLIAKINAKLGTKIQSGRNASTAEAKAAMLGGHVDGVIANVSEYYGLIDSTGDDAIRILAVFAENRSDFIPDVPTAAECGYPDLFGASDRGLIGPPTLDPAVKEVLINTLKEIQNDPEFLADAKTQGLGIGMIFGEDFEKYIGDIEATMTEMKPLFGWN